MGLGLGGADGVDVYVNVNRRIMPAAAAARLLCRRLNLMVYPNKQ
jgi:hypothetical protein